MFHWISTKTARFAHTRQAILTYCQHAVAVALTGGGPVRGGTTRPLPQIAERSVLITGASSGIGHAVALKLIATRAQLVLVGRSEAKLEALQAEIRARGGDARIYAVDLSKPAGVTELLTQLTRDRVRVDILINSAGRSIRRSVAQAADRPHDYERTMAINYFGAVRLTLGLLPGMRQRKYGQVVNISSTGAQMASPMFSAYVASKAALDAFTSIAGNELRSEGLSFTTVHMPLVRTPMIAPTPDYQTLPVLTPEQAADLVLRALTTREPHIGTWLGSAFQLAHVLAPELASRWLNRGYRFTAQAAAETGAAGADTHALS